MDYVLIFIDGFLLDFDGWKFDFLLDFDVLNFDGLDFDVLDFDGLEFDSWENVVVWSFVMLSW